GGRRRVHDRADARRRHDRARDPAARAMTTVLLADDHPVYRDGLSRAVQRAGLELVGACADGVEALRLIREALPDVALLDGGMPELDGLAVLRHVVHEQLRTRIVLLSAAFDPELVYGALAEGAAGYLPKDADRDAICEAVVRVAEGGAAIAPEVQAGL